MLHCANIIGVVFLQMLLQDFIYIKGNSILLYIPLLICNIIFFEFADAMLANMILIFVFCSLFTNGLFMNIFLIVLLLFINKQLKEKIYLERIEIFLTYLFGFLISLNFLRYLTESYVHKSLPNVSLILSTTVIQFVLDSIFGVFIYFIISRESKYLRKLKKGRSLREE